MDEEKFTGYSLNLKRQGGEDNKEYKKMANKTYKFFLLPDGHWAT